MKTDLDQLIAPSECSLPRRLLFALVLTLIVGTLMPGSVKAAIEGGLWAGVPWSAMAHFALFGAIAALPVYGCGQRALWSAMGLALALAAGTESLQHWVPGRYPMLRDVAIDLAGALAGCVLQVGLRRVRARRTGSVSPGAVLP